MGGVEIPYWGKIYNAEYDFRNYLLHITFLSFLDVTVANSVLSVEWTLPIEVFWYIFLPIFVLFSKKWWLLLAWLCVGLVLPELAKFLVAYAELPHGDQHRRWLPTHYGYYFVLGIIAHKFRAEVRQAWPRLSASLVYGGIAIFLAVCLFRFGNPPTMIALATFLIICGFAPSHHLNRVLANRCMLFLGTVSYGLYLVHFPIIYVFDSVSVESQGFVGFIAVFLTAIVVSVILFHLVERPSNQWVKRNVTPSHRAGRRGRR